MPTTLRYGRDATIDLDLPDESVLADWSHSDGQPLSDPAAAVAAALVEPLDFPPLARAVTPDDHVAIALGSGIPQMPAVVAGIVHVLLEAGIDARRIAVVRTAEDARQDPRDPRESLPAALRDQVTLVTHEGDERAKISFLGPSSADEPIYLNRVLCDADVVIPVACLRYEASPGYTGVHGPLYPAFADDAARLRRQSADLTTEMQRAQQRREAEEVAWLLGVLLTVQIVPGGDDTVLEVLAGDARSVARHGSERMRAAWSRQASRHASLVVASIEGGQEQQTWDNFARALHAAAQAVADDGAIAICSELSQRPGPRLMQLADTVGDNAWQQSADIPSADATPAAELARVRENTRVYLLSRLDEDLVESLGMAHVASRDEIARLATRHPSCILIGGAQHACPACGAES